MKRITEIVKTAKTLVAIHNELVTWQEVIYQTRDKELVKLFTKFVNLDIELNDYVRTEIPKAVQYERENAQFLKIMRPLKKEFRKKKHGK